VGFDRAALNQASRFLTALGDPMRLQIHYLLAIRDASGARV